MATTTTVDTQAIVAGSGGTSTPVKLTLQSGTQAVSVQIKVTTTRTASPTPSSGLRKEFTLYWAFSPEDLTLADVPTLLRHCAKSQAMVLNPDIERAGQRQQIRDKVNGQYMYLWFGYPQSPDAYSVVVTTTELFFLNSNTDPSFTTITVTGQSKFSDGTAAAPSISFINDTDTGFYRIGSNNVGLSLGGAVRFNFDTNTLSAGYTGDWTIQNVQSGARTVLGAAGNIALTAFGTDQNITLTPSGTGSVLVSSVITSASAPSSQLDVFNNGATLQAGSTLDFKVSGGTQAARILPTTARFLLGTIVDSGALLQIGTNTTTSLGGMVFGTDTFLYRSAAGTLTFSGGFATGGSIICNAGGTFQWLGRSAIGSPSDGVIRLTDNAGTDFTRLQFGGTTSSFPALKRSSAGLQAYLADDSGFAGFEAGVFVARGTGGAGYFEGIEQSSDPSAPSADRGRLFFKDNGAGKTQLAVRFSTGATQVIATEP